MSRNTHLKVGTVAAVRKASRTATDWAQAAEASAALERQGNDRRLYGASTVSLTTGSGRINIAR